MMDQAAAASAPLWDGIARGYVPQIPPRVDPAVRLQTDAETDIDPVTYEVVRYALTNINREQGDLIQRLSLSPIVALARDYCASVLNEVGDLVCVSGGIQYFSDQTSLAVKYILEHRGAGIRDGNVFLCNDPFVGSAHQSDVSLVTPVFIDGAVFCWIANSMHHQDVGGPSPGSQYLASTDAWSEPAHWPPTVLVEHGEMRADIEALFIRQCRFPGLTQMDLRAAIGAINATRSKLLALVARYGAPGIKGAMARILDNSEQAFAARLDDIPDGTWSHLAYMEAAVPGDRDAYPYQVNITKSAGRLIIDNDGTGPQVGAINLTYSGFSGIVKAAIVLQMLPEMAGNYGGAYRRLDFRPQPGLMNCADYPASVASSGAFTVETMLNVAATAVCKMLGSGSGEIRALSLGAPVPDLASLVIAGVDAHGEQFLVIGADGMMGALAGRAGRDGSDVGGHWWIPDASGYNVEDIEAQSPFMVLARALLPAGVAGAGRHRGGMGFRETLIARGIRGAQMVLYHNESFTRGVGLFGGNPVSLATCRVKHGTNVFAEAARGTLRCAIDEISGEETDLLFKGPPCPLADGDVVEWVSPCAAGYGDPLLRDPGDVRDDVAAGLVSPDDAGRIYQVVFRDGTIDDDATRARRTAARAERLGGHTAGDPVAPPPGAHQVGDLLHVVDGRWWCNGADLGPASETYKTKAILREIPVRSLGPEYDSKDVAMADAFVFREFLCPATGLRIDTELARIGTPALRDIAVHR